MKFRRLGQLTIDIEKIHAYEVYPHDNRLFIYVAEMVQPLVLPDEEGKLKKQLDEYTSAS
jgi:hypothetical protein